MRQLLHRLRKSGADLVEGDQVIALCEGVACDLRQLSALDLGAALALADAPPLLAGHEHGDAPDFADWLQATREQLRALQLQALDHEAARLKAAGAYAEALAIVQQHLHHDPLAEAAHRRLMRLHHLLDDRAAARAAYRRCEAVLSAYAIASTVPLGAGMPHHVVAYRQDELSPCLSRDALRAGAGLAGAGRDAVRQRRAFQPRPAARGRAG